MKPTTDMEELVRHLAGRGDQGIDLSSDQTQLLEAIRSRTRVFFEDQDDPDSDRVGWRPHAWGSVGSRTDGDPHSKVNPLRWALGLGLFAAVLCSSIAGFWRLGERSASIRTREQTRNVIEQMRILLASEPPAGLPGPRETEVERTAANWSRIESDLKAIQAKLDVLSRLSPVVVSNGSNDTPLTRDQSANLPAMSPVNPAPDLVSLKADLAAIRSEVVNGEAATTRQVQEMRTVLHELNTVVRRVLSRPQQTTNNNVTLPLLAVAVQALINNLQHQNAQVRGDAVEQLTRLGPLARSALPALQQMMTREPDANVRLAVETAVNIISSN